MKTVIQCQSCGKTIKNNGVSTHCRECWRKQTYGLRCRICGDTFTTRSKKAQYCSNCTAAARHLMYEKHKTAALKRAEKQRDKERFGGQRKVILERDNYRCRLCGETEGRLHVHHIKGRIGPDPHTDANLITLCDACHAKLHPVRPRFFVCAMCGSTFISKIATSKYCEACRPKAQKEYRRQWIRAKGNTCVDCGAHINNRSTRCQPCNCVYIGTSRRHAKSAI